MRLVFKDSRGNVHAFDDPKANADTIFHPDGTIERCADIAPSIAYNEQLRNNADGYTKSRELKHVANIPPVIWEEIMRQGFHRDSKALRRFLNDIDHRGLRTSGGRL